MQVLYFLVNIQMDWLLEMNYYLCFQELNDSRNELLNCHYPITSTQT